MNQAVAVQKGRLQFLLLATLFFAPMLAASILYFWFPDSRPTATTNYGDLVSPARPLPDATLLKPDGTAAEAELLYGRWNFVQISDGQCAEACGHRLVMSRQVRTALNEKRQRVQRVLIVPGAAEAAALAAQLSGDHPDLQIVADPEGTLITFFAQDDAGTLLLTDPNRNWVMRYPSGHSVEDDFKGIQKDVKKLLRLSSIG